MGRSAIVLVGKVFAASLFVALPLHAAGPAQAQSNEVFNMTCKSGDVVDNWVIDPRAQTVSYEAQFNPPGLPPSHLSAHYPDPTFGTSSVQVNDATVVWSITPVHGLDPGPTTYTLNRYTGVMHQTRPPGGHWPNGEETVWACERKQKAF